jgi:hypothetical protein
MENCFAKNARNVANAATLLACLKLGLYLRILTDVFYESHS